MGASGTTTGAKKRGLSALDKAYGQKAAKDRRATGSEPPPQAKGPKLRDVKPAPGGEASDPGGIYAELPASVPSDDLADVLLLDRSPTGERSLEAVLLKLFASGRHAFRTDVALAGKVHDKVLLLDNPPRKSVSAAAAVSAAAVRKKLLTSSCKPVRKFTRQAVIECAKDAVKAGTLTHPAFKDAAHSGWCTYISKLLSTCLPATAPKALESCNLIGADVLVAASRDAMVIGAQGIVIWTSVSYLHLLTPENTIVSALRAKCVFSVHLPDSTPNSFTIGAL